MPAVLSILLKLRFRVNSNPTLSASLFSIVYEHRVVLACNGVQREYNVAWPSTCAWRIDTEAGNGQIRETRSDEELQLRMICSPSLCPR